MVAHIVLSLIFLVLIAGCAALLRSASRQRRVRNVPSDLHRADDAERGEPFDAGKAYRAVQDAFDQSQS
jgi:hypothetical protein